MCELLNTQGTFGGKPKESLRYFIILIFVCDTNMPGYRHLFCLGTHCFLKKLVIKIVTNPAAVK